MDSISNILRNDRRDLVRIMIQAPLRMDELLVELGRCSTYLFRCTVSRNVG